VWRKGRCFCRLVCVVCEDVRIGCRVQYLVQFLRSDFDPNGVSWANYSSIAHVHENLVLNGL